MGHEIAGHIVTDQSNGDLVPYQLTGGEPGSLEQGAGLVGVDHGYLPLSVGRADDPQGRPVAPGCQGSGVAVGEDAGTLRDQLRPRLAHGLVHLDVLPVNGPSLLLQKGQVGTGGLPAPFHTLQGPEQVHRRGTAGGKDRLGLGHSGREISFTGTLLSGQHHGVGHRDPDGGRAPDHHAADGPGDSPVLGVPQPAFLSGQTGLVQEIEGAVFPADILPHNARSLQVRERRYLRDVPA